MSLAEHHLLVMWSAAFYLLERYADEISDQELKANILKVLSASRGLMAVSSWTCSKTVETHYLFQWDFPPQRFVIVYEISESSGVVTFGFSVSTISL